MKSMEVCQIGLLCLFVLELPFVAPARRIEIGCGLVATNADGVAVFTSLFESVPAWLFCPGWNLMRVTRRGPGTPAEWFLCDEKSRFLSIHLR